jgi:hypothetical protein
VAQLGDVDPARGNIRRDQYADLARLEAGQRLGAL